jgi:effector-binding domain-containing protein
MIRIGQFSRLAQVSVKTLRFYDEQGLLHPALVDTLTGYRYYTFDQLAHLRRILAFKELGFSLGQIGHLLNENLDAGQVQALLIARRAEIAAHLVEEHARLKRVDAWLSLMQQENNMNSLDVIIKQVEPMQVASLRAIIPTYSQQGLLWRELDGYLAMQRIRSNGPCLTIYHDEDYKESDVDAEVCEPVDVLLTGTTRIRVQTLPAQTVASTIHNGPYTSLGTTIGALIRWIDDNGYRITGPEREIYLHPSKNGSQTDPQTVTEIQFPIEAAEC